MRDANWSTAPHSSSWEGKPSICGGMLPATDIEMSDQLVRDATTDMPQGRTCGPFLRPEPLSQPGRSLRSSISPIAGVDNSSVIHFSTVEKPRGIREQGPVAGTRFPVEPGIKESRVGECESTSGK